MWKGNPTSTKPSSILNAPLTTDSRGRRTLGNENQKFKCLSEGCVRVGPVCLVVMGPLQGFDADEEDLVTDACKFLSRAFQYFSKVRSLGRSKFIKPINPR